MAGQNRNGSAGQNTFANSTASFASTLKDSGGSDYTGALAVFSGWDHHCILINNYDEIRCWGKSINGNMGPVGADSAYALSHAVLTSNITGLSTKGYGTDTNNFVDHEGHSCAVDSSNNLKCWGSSNLYGQLGNNSTAITTATVTPVDGGLAALSNITQVATGVDFTCAVHTVGAGGGIKCWGSNSYSKLGIGNSTNTPTATPVIKDDEAGGTETVSGATLVAAGARYACAIISSDAWCWGQDVRIGDNAAAGHKNNAVRVRKSNNAALTGVVDLDAGNDSACAVLSDGTVWCWGSANSGRLGNDTNTPDVDYAVQVLKDDGAGGSEALTDAVRVTVGAYHACAILNAGANRATWCWGDNDNGQLGINTTGDKYIAFQVKKNDGGGPENLLNVTQIDASENQTRNFRKLWMNS